MDKKIIKWAGKVRDVDRQYEKNNNCDVDNGVYNKFAYDSQSQEKEVSELNPLECNEESLEEATGGKETPLTLLCVSSARDLFEKAPIDESVQTFLLNSLVSQPLVIGKKIFIICFR